MKDIRWKQRFAHFERALGLLREGLEQRPPAELSDLEKEGIIQRFEYTFELVWKSLKDYLEFSGVVIEPVTPRAVIKAAFAANIIADGQVWIDMLDQRNLMAHTYDQENFERAFKGIAERFIEPIKQAFDFLKRQSV